MDRQKEIKNVLLVDDDQIFNFISQKTLSNIGFAGEIHSAVNGQAALDLINTYYSRTVAMPDVILLDLNMPIMDGFGFLEAFRKLNDPKKDSVRIVVVSSSVNPDDIERAKLLGACGYLSKPVNEQKLRDLLFGELKNKD